MNRLIRFARSRGPYNAVRLTLLASFLLAGVFSAFGQTPTPGSRTEGPTRLSPDTAVEMAIKNNLLLEQARIGTDIKKRKSDLVWNEFLPTIGANGTLARTNWQLSEQGFDFNTFKPYSITDPQWSVNAGISAELTFSFALIQGIRSFKQDYQASLITLDKARLQMEQGVRKLYNNILLVEANARLLEESFKNSQRQAEIAEANYRAGLAPRLNWLQAQVAVENIRPQVNDLENNLKSLKGNFAMLLGLPFDASLELEPVAAESSFIPLELEEFISKSAAKPDIKELQAQLVTLQTQRKAQSLQMFTPYLRFGWTLSTMFNPLLSPFEESWFSGDNWQKGGQGTGGAFSITVGMSLNSLFGFTKEGQALKDTDAGARIKSIQLAQMIRETEMEIFTKINSLEQTRTSAAVQQAAVELAEQSYRLTEEAYRAGLQDFQAVQNSALALDQAKLQLLTQQFNFLNDLIDLEYSVGVPFGTLSSSGISGNKESN
jgi:outer membrane protein TolC